MQTAKELVRTGAVLCPLCYGTLTVHGSYSRHCRDEGGNRSYGWIAQGHCITCNVYPALIPDFIMAYKHYKTEVIEGVVAACEEGNVVEGLGGYAADASTMRRWVRQFRERGAQSVGWLLSGLLTVYERHIGSLEMRNKSLLKQLAWLLQEYPVSESSGVFGRANIILTTRNCGFL